MNVLCKDLIDIIETYKNQLMFNDVIEELNARINYGNVLISLRFNNWQCIMPIRYYEFLQYNYYPHTMRIFTPSIYLP